MIDSTKVTVSSSAWVDVNWRAQQNLDKRSGRRRPTFHRPRASLRASRVLMPARTEPCPPHLDVAVDTARRIGRSALLTDAQIRRRCRMSFAATNSTPFHFETLNPRPARLSIGFRLSLMAARRKLFGTIRHLESWRHISCRFKRTRFAKTVQPLGTSKPRSPIRPERRSRQELRSCEYFELLPTSTRQWTTK
jgi:hypothetical protein